MDRYPTKYNKQVDNNISVADQVKSGVLSHQKRFYFLIHHMPKNMDSDSLVELVWDDFTFGKRHKTITDMAVSDDTLIIAFDERLCYRFGKHSLNGGKVLIELVKKSEYDTNLRRKVALKWKSKESKTNESD